MQTRSKTLLTQFCKPNCRNKNKILSYCLFSSNNHDNWYVQKGKISETQKNQLYYIGLYQNAALAEQLFPDWTMHVYINESCAQSIHIQRITQHYPKIKFINVETTYPWFVQADMSMMLARMLPMLQEDNSHVLSLDLDNTLSKPLKAEAQKWLQSGKQCFLPKEKHGVIPGGFYGLGSTIDKQLLEKNLKALFDKKKQDYKYGFDENFLEKQIKPLVSSSKYLAKGSLKKLLPVVQGKLGSQIKKSQRKEGAKLPLFVDLKQRFDRCI